MSQPVPLPTGGIMDMRGLLIGTATGLLGPIVGIFPLATGLGLRLHIGGPGTVPGLASMLLAFAGGLVWHYAVKPRGLTFWRETPLLGLLISTQSLAIFLADAQYWGQLFTTLAVYTTTCNLVGTGVLKFLLEGEISYASQKEVLAEAAATDHLTGLLNRRSLEQEFAAIQRRNRPTDGMTALYFDVDHFKRINDTYGHLSGDIVLKEITTRLAHVIGSRDIFCRLGGDEFVIVLPGATEAEAREIAARCCEIVAETPVLAEGDLIPVTISMGAFWTRLPTSFEGLLSNADKALYEAKASGRNTVAFQARPGPPSDMARSAA